MRSAITYEEWIASEGKMNEWGTKALVSDKIILKSHEVKKRLGKIMGEAIAKALIENGERARDVSVTIEWDAFFGAYEYTSIANSIQGNEVEEYVTLSYHCWQSEQTRRINWENKSLWGYLKYWFRRKFK